MCKLPTLVVSYCPDEKSLGNIVALAESASLFLYDNSPQPIVSTVVLTGAVVFHEERNRGIAAALIWMADECVLRGNEYFLFLDQDTRIAQSSIEEIEETLRGGLPQSVDIYHFTSDEVKGRAPRFVINSGTVFRASFIIQHRSTLARYFVDAIDLALCQIARKDGRAIVSRCIRGIDHDSGQGHEHYRLCGHTFSIKPCSAFRRREFYRGHLRLFFDLLQSCAITDMYYVAKFVVGFTLSRFASAFIVWAGVRVG
jgi:hypothetical protein